MCGILVLDLGLHVLQSFELNEDSKLNRHLIKYLYFVQRN